MKNKILAIIPARKNSKRLKNKNLLLFNKKPLIHWTIKSALKSKKIDTIVVSSDSKKILDYSKKIGVKNLILRPKKYSSSNVSSWTVVRHALKNLEISGKKYDLVLLLQPTSPLRTHYHINKIINQFNKKYNGIVSVNEFSKPINWIASYNKDMSLNIFKKNIKKKISTKNYILNGALYLLRVSFIKSKKSIFDKSIKIYPMPLSNSIDIDNAEEFKLAEVIHKSKITC